MVRVNRAGVGPRTPRGAEEGDFGFGRGPPGPAGMAPAADAGLFGPPETGGGGGDLGAQTQTQG